MMDPACVVVLRYLDSETYFDGFARTRLLEDVELYLSGKVDRASGDHTAYDVGEFKDDNHRHALIFERTC
jgi:hypothetical protein